MILDYLKSERFTNISDLQKHLTEREKEEGYSFKLDKKSTARLVYSLYKNQKLKIFKAILKSDKGQTEIEFICDSSLESSDPIIKVAIEQAKFKYFGVPKDCAKQVQVNKKPKVSAKQVQVNKKPNESAKQVQVNKKTKGSAKQVQVNKKLITKPANRFTSTAGKSADGEKSAMKLPKSTISHPKLLKGKEIAKHERRSRLQVPKENALEKAKAKTAMKCSSGELGAIEMRSTKERNYYDDKDKGVMKKLKRAHCVWTPQEDSFLLLCKVASSFLEPYNTSTLVVPKNIVRDLLHQHVPGLSENKTSRACERRLKSVVLNSPALSNVSVFLGEALQDVELVKEFDKPKPPKANIIMWRPLFTSVLNKLLEKFTLPASDRCGNLSLPNNLQEFKERFKILSNFDQSNRKRIYKEPECIEDIQKSVLTSLILSAMALVNDGAQWSFLLHRLYQNYSENALHTVVSHLRKERVIAAKEKSHGRHVHRSLCTCPYKFSVTYSSAMLTKVPVKIFKEAREFLKILNTPSVETSGFELKGDVPLGFAAAVLSLVTMQKLSIHTEIPDQILLLDPSLKTNANIAQNKKRMANTLSDKELLELDNQNNDAAPQITEEMEEEEHCAASLYSVSRSEMADSDLLSLANANQSESQCFQNASRYALHLSRNEISRPPIEREQYLIILNSCRVFCRPKPVNSFPPLPINPSDVIEKTSEKAIESECIPQTELTEEHISEIADLVLSYIPVGAFVTKQSYTENFKEVYDQYSAVAFREGEYIFNYIYKANVKGVVEKELWHEFGKLNGELSFFEHLTLLRKAVLVIRVGVVEFTYVCCCFASLWVLKSFPMESIRQKIEKQATISPKLADENSSLKSDHSKSKSNTDNSTERIYMKTSYLNYSPCSNNEAASKKASKPVEICTSEAHMDDALYFISRTWRNPDGSLNNLVFFELLSAVLSHIIALPGISSPQVSEHFMQVMPSVQTLELIEVLEKGKCVYKYYCKRVTKCGLFSPKSTYVITENPEPEDIDHVEPFPDAVCKLAKLQAVL